MTAARRRRRGVRGFGVPQRQSARQIEVRQEGATLDPRAAGPGEAEQALIELARQHPGQVVAGLLDQFVTLLGGSTPNISIQGLVRQQLCRGTVDALLSQGLGASDSTRRRFP